MVQFPDVSKSGTQHNLFIKQNENTLKEYYLQRVPINYKSECYMNPTMWTGPARRCFGDTIMTLYHVTDEYAADNIKKSRTMKCGKQADLQNIFC